MSEKRFSLLLIAAFWMAQVLLYFWYQSRPRHPQPICDIIWCFICGAAYTAYIVWSYRRISHIGQFDLLGWDNPHGHYPATVVPIGMLYGQLVAVYPGGTVRIDPISEYASYVRFTAEQLAALRGFDHLNEQLFAMSEDQVSRCPLHDPSHQVE
ncbi:MAG: hypothetical protein WCF77_04060 [Minisyncoccia bacterium]|jgi:hypothetical protein